MSRAPTNLGGQLVVAMRDRRAAAGDDVTYFPAFAVGYLEGLINDMAGAAPEARKVAEHHLARQRGPVAARS